MSFRDPTGAVEIGTAVAQKLLAQGMSDAAIGVAVANQILAKGVPQVLLTTRLTPGSIVQSGGTTQFEDYDISPYAAIVFIPSMLSSARVQFQLFQYDVAGGRLMDEAFVDWTNGDTASAGPLRWNVSGQSLRVMNLQPAGVQQAYTLIGLNRSFPKKLSSAYGDTDGVRHTVAVSAAGTFAFPANTTLKVEGACLARLGISGGATTRANLQLVNRMGTMTLMGDNEMAASGTNGVGSKIVHLPVGAHKLQVAVTTFVAAGTAALDLIPIF